MSISENHHILTNKAEFYFCNIETGKIPARSLPVSNTRQDWETFYVCIYMLLWLAFQLKWLWKPLSYLCHEEVRWSFCLKSNFATHSQVSGSRHLHAEKFVFLECCSKHPIFFRACLIGMVSLLLSSHSLTSFLYILIFYLCFVHVRHIAFPHLFSLVFMSFPCNCLIYLIVFLCHTFALHKCCFPTIFLLCFFLAMLLEKSISWPFIHNSLS